MANTSPAVTNGSTPAVQPDGPQRQIQQSGVDAGRREASTDGIRYAAVSTVRSGSSVITNARRTVAGAAVGALTGNFDAAKAAANATVAAAYELRTNLSRTVTAVAAHTRSAFVFSDRAATRQAIDKKNYNTAIPLIARGTSASPDNVAGLNRPYIQVLRDAEGGIADGEDATTKRSLFDMFILTAVNVVDAEKMDVVETFGNPHFFASGRFTKKLTLTGLVRSEARAHITSRRDNLGAQAALERDNTDRNVVSDYAVFRNFYEQYLRATVMASNGTYVRVFVDGDFFDGYVQALQFGRSSDMEQVIPWTMQMILFRSWNVFDNRAQSILKKDIRDTGKRAAALTARQALAEIEDAVGKCDLFTFPFGSTDAVAATSSATSGQFKSGAIPPLAVSQDKPDGAASIAAAQLPALYANGNGRLQVQVSNPQLNGVVELVYVGTGDPRVVHESAAPPQPAAVRMRVINYSALSALAFPDGTAEPRPVSVDFVVSTQTRSSVTLTGQVTIDGRASFVVKVDGATVQAAATSSPVDINLAVAAESGQANATTARAQFQPARRTVTIDSSGNFRFIMKFGLLNKVGAGGNQMPLTVRDAGQVRVTVKDQKVQPVRTRATTGPSTPVVDQPDNGISSSQMSVTSDTALLASDGTMTVTFNGTINGASSWAGSDNPLKYSTAIEFNANVEIAVPGYAPHLVKFSIAQGLGRAAGISGMFSQIKIGGRQLEKVANGWKLSIYLMTAPDKPAPTPLSQELISAIRQSTVSLSTADNGSGDLTATFSLSGGNQNDVGTINEYSGFNASYRTAVVSVADPVYDAVNKAVRVDVVLGSKTAEPSTLTAADSLTNVQYRSVGTGRNAYRVIDSYTVDPNALYPAVSGNILSVSVTNAELGSMTAYTRPEDRRSRGGTSSPSPDSGIIR